MLEQEKIRIIDLINKTLLIIVIILISIVFINGTMIKPAFISFIIWCLSVSVLSLIKLNLQEEIEKKRWKQHNKDYKKRI